MSKPLRIFQLTLMGIGLTTAVFGLDKDADVFIWCLMIYLACWLSAVLIQAIYQSDDT